MTRETFLRRFPRLYHLAWGGAWPIIQQKGLMSTETLLDAYHVVGEQRTAILEEHRPNPVPLGQGVVVRDTRNLDPKRLPNILTGGATPQQYRLLLNQKVFLWPELERLNRMLGAYLHQPQTLIVIESQRLVPDSRYFFDHVELSRINSGTIQHDAPQRGLDVFNDPLIVEDDAVVAEVVFRGIIPADVLNASIGAFEVYSIENDRFERLYPDDPTLVWKYHRNANGEVCN